MSLALFGRLLILAALAFACAGAVLGFHAGRSRSALALKLARRFAYAFAGALILATLVMEYALLTHDFSVSYVAQVGSRATPIHITIVSLWSSLEGSILFWGLVLAVFVAALTRSLRDKNLAFAPDTIGVVLAIGSFFAFLLAGPANPFGDVPNVPLDGPGPNPLLQNHPLMIVHPPLLYLGYVGMAIPFAMGAAALIHGGMSSAWMSSIRRWMLIPWTFLTGGIVMGGWWAYEVLGWGGYWAWDPVENASFLPWLTATAFLHAAMLQERRGQLKAWTLVLLFVTFALTILGTFMTRSGVFNSVHSFTQSAIGPTFLVFLAVVLIFSVFLLAFRVNTLEPGRPLRSWRSRDFAFIFNNLLLVLFTFTVLVGTCFPLLVEAIRGAKLSVGEPFFNQFALPIGTAIVFLMGIGPALPWGRASADDAKTALLWPVVLSVVVTSGAAGLLMAQGHEPKLWPLLCVAASTLALVVALRDMWTPIRALRKRHDSGLGTAAIKALKRGRRRYGGQIVHIGVALVTLSIGISGGYREIGEKLLKRGESMKVGDYTLTFAGSKNVSDPHRQRILGIVRVASGDRQMGEMYPAMNHYPRQMNPIGTPAVRSTLTGDLYLSAMQIDPAGSFIGLRVYLNPAVPWLWVGMFVMMVGGTISAWPGRRRKRGPAAAEAA
ncbi:MAG: heme lyase CcmF/NrfE family subunit [Deltaproteobacteria bacterium]|nr:heme lyase CcmF/NrfE family subunit [Deltaproteobacteria bacterium]